MIDTIERVSISKITVHEFIEKFEKGSKPFILTGVADAWPAWQQWKVSVRLKFILTMLAIARTVWIKFV